MMDDRRMKGRSVVVLFMLLVWQRLSEKSSNGGQLAKRLVVHMLYALAYFMMLNTIDLAWFVTLTLWYCVTPQQLTHRLIT